MYDGAMGRCHWIFWDFGGGRRGWCRGFGRIPVGAGVSIAGRLAGWGGTSGSRSGTVAAGGGVKMGCPVTIGAAAGVGDVIAGSFGAGMPLSADGTDLAVHNGALRLPEQGGRFVMQGMMRPGGRARAARFAANQRFLDILQAKHRL